MTRRRSTRATSGSPGCSRRSCDHAGVDFGILFDAERTAGNDVRRVGEEGLFASLAEHNVATISACEFERILTTDPHTYNTLRNEYPDFGGSWPVVHHSQLLAELLGDGHIALGARSRAVSPTTIPATSGATTACTTRPRDVLRTLGLELVEMPRNRDNSFCCGAGGGRIWMSDSGARVARDRASRGSPKRWRWEESTTSWSPVPRT